MLARNLRGMDTDQKIALLVDAILRVEAQLRRIAEGQAELLALIRRASDQGLPASEHQPGAVV